MYEIKASETLKNCMADHFYAFKGTSKKIAWCTSVGPAELLRSFGFEVHFPENHGAVLGASRKATELIPLAAGLGYSSDICSYLTADIGSYLSKATPLTKGYGLEGVPKADLLVYNTNQCREVQDWFEYFGKEFSAPVYGIKSPRYLDKVEKADIENVKAQFIGLIPVAEKVSGKKFDLDTYKNVLRLSKEATFLWKDCLNTSLSTPAPISFFDATIHMGPIVVLRGTQVAKDYYTLLKKELTENVTNGIGFLEKENCRLYWDGMPIWGKLRNNANLFLQNNAAVVASTYCNSWIFDAFDEKYPFDSAALAYLSIFINRSEKAKFEVLKKHIEDFKINGVIFHDSKTCFNNTNSRFGLPMRLKEELGVETLIIEGDLCDLRFYSEDQTTTKIETFLEQIG